MFVQPVNSAEYKTCIAEFKDSDKKNIVLNILVADSDQTRRKGLMFRKKLDENTGMLFIFNKEILLRFWMKNTSIPLSIAYINKKGRILEIYDMRPFDTSIIYLSKNPVMFALEVNQGWFRRHGIKIGDIIFINGCISK